MDTIAKDFKCGESLRLGKYVIIEPGVVVGDNVKIGHRVTLKSGAIIGNNSIIDDHCITTGACFIGNHVNIRTGAIISKATVIEDYCFIGPGVITNHTKHISYGRQDKIPDIQLLTYIGFGAVLGSQASILAGITIAPQTIIGGGTVVVKSLKEKAIYAGCPASKIGAITEKYLIPEPSQAGSMYLTKNILEHLKSFIPNLAPPEI